MKYSINSSLQRKWSQNNVYQLCHQQIAQLIHSQMQSNVTLFSSLVTKTSIAHTHTHRHTHSHAIMCTDNNYNKRDHFSK